MIPAEVPHIDRLLELSDHRDDASVTIAIPSSHLPSERDRVRISFRNAVDDAERQFAKRGTSNASAEAVIATLRDLHDDADFWTQQATSLIVMATPETVHAFRIANRVEENVSVSDRFDTSALLRAVAFPHRAFVIELTKDATRLIEFTPSARPAEHDLNLPDDHQLMLEHTTTGGRYDRQRADGAAGDNPERRRYARAAQDEVVRAVPNDVPLVLAASADLQTAYRAVNTHPLLLATGIDAHPNSLDNESLATHVREILDDYYAHELDEWRENFGTLRSQGLATSRLAEVAKAAVEAAIDTLHFNMDWNEEGTIDEFGRVERTDAPGPDTYGIVDEIAARVLRSGGSVRAVRNADLIDGSPVAATLRFPLTDKA